MTAPLPVIADHLDARTSENTLGHGVAEEEGFIVDGEMRGSGRRGQQRGTARLKINCHTDRLFQIKIIILKNNIFCKAKFVSNE